MKNLYIILVLFSQCLSNAQCDVKTNYRQDGNVIKYFNPNPIIRENDYEVGTSLYFNESTNRFFINISVLFKSLAPQEATNDLIIQLNGTNKSILLPIVESSLIQMNGRELAVALYEVDEYNLDLISNHSLKHVFFSLNDKLFGALVSENKTLLINQYSCLNSFATLKSQYKKNEIDKVVHDNYNENEENAKALKNNAFDYEEQNLFKNYDLQNSESDSNPSLNQFYESNSKPEPFYEKEQFNYLLIGICLILFFLLIRSIK